VGIKSKKPRVVSCDSVLLTMRAQALRLPRLFPSTVYGYGGPHGMRFAFCPAIRKVLRQVHPDKDLSAMTYSIMHDLVSELLFRIVTAAASMCTAYLRLGHEDSYETVGAGPEGIEGSLSDDVTVRIYQFYDDDGDDPFYEEDEEKDLEEEEFDRNCPVLSAYHIQKAVHHILPGELAKHAVSEATKAVTKAVKSGAGEMVDCFDAAGLVYRPEHAAYFAKRLGHHVTDTGSVYLASVCEYITTEVLELAGNCASDLTGESKCDDLRVCIYERDIMLAVHGDEELYGLYYPGVMRNAGLVPHLQKSIKAHASPEKVEGGNANPSFDGWFKENMKSLSGDGIYGVAIDPRDGLHYSYCDDDDDYDGEGSIQWEPLFDVCCAESAEQRRDLALSILPLEGKLLLEREGLCALTEAEASATKGTTIATEGQLRVARGRRLRDIRSEQRRGDFCLDQGELLRLLQRLASEVRLEHDGHDLSWTAEAFEVLQTACERYLIAVIETAMIVLIKSGSKSYILSTEELDCASRIAII